jgi:hypothetical protein
MDFISCWWKNMECGKESFYLEYPKKNNLKLFSAVDYDTEKFILFLKLEKAGKMQNLYECKHPSLFLIMLMF